VRRVEGTIEKPKSGAIGPLGVNSTRPSTLRRGACPLLSTPFLQRPLVSLTGCRNLIYGNADASYDSNEVVTNKMKEMTIPPLKVASTNDRLIFMVAGLKRSPPEKVEYRLLCLKAVAKGSDVKIIRR